MRNRLLLMMVLLGYGATAQVVSDSLQVEGYYRSFHFNKPTTTRKDGSLVFVLHGSGGNGKGMMQYAPVVLERTAKENVILVYADGYKHYWNE